MTDNQQNQENIKLSLVIDFDIAHKHKDRIVPIMEEIVNNLFLSSSGNGVITPGSTYQYKLTSNQPSEPMTVDRLFELIRQAQEE